MIIWCGNNRSFSTHYLRASRSSAARPGGQSQDTRPAQYTSNNMEEGNQLQGEGTPCRTAQGGHVARLEHVVNEAVGLVLAEARAVVGDHARAVLAPVLQHQQPLEHLRRRRALRTASSARLNRLPGCSKYRTPLEHLRCRRALPTASSKGFRDMARLGMLAPRSITPKSQSSETPLPPLRPASTQQRGSVLALGSCKEGAPHPARPSISRCNYASCTQVLVMDVAFPAAFPFHSDRLVAHSKQVFSQYKSLPHILLGQARAALHLC